MALGLLADTGERAVQPAPISFNAEVSACVKGGQWQLAVGLHAKCMAQCAQRELWEQQAQVRKTEAAVEVASARSMPSVGWRSILCALPAQRCSSA